MDSAVLVAGGLSLSSLSCSSAVAVLADVAVTMTIHRTARQTYQKGAEKILRPFLLSAIQFAHDMLLATH